MSEHCRSCGAEIEWAVTPAGKRIPLDKLAVKDGNIVLSSRTNSPGVAIVQDQGAIEYLKSQSEKTGQPYVLFKSHFATCPQAGKWRK